MQKPSHNRTDKHEEWQLVSWMGGSHKAKTIGALGLPVALELKLKLL